MMDSWLTPAVVTALVTGFFTYLQTRRSTEGIYTKEVTKMLAGYKEDVKLLRKELEELKEELTAKDELILELRLEKQRLYNENGELKQKIRILRGEQGNG